MKCICGSGANEEIERLRGLLDRVLREVRTYRPPGVGLELMLEIARFLNSSSPTLLEAKSREDLE